MTGSHPTPEALARYVRGELSREESRELERHLMTCLACQSALDQIPDAPAGKVKWRGHRFRVEKPQPDPAEEARRENLRGVLRGLGEVIGILGEKELRDLLREPEHRRRALIRKEERYRSIQLCELLEARCRQAWFQDPEAAVEYAKLAVLIADRLDPEHYGSKQVRNVKALAWMHLGNAFRIVSELNEANDASTADREPSEEEPAAGEDEYPEIEIPGFAVAEASHLAPYLAEAEAALLETRDAFLERGMGFDAALASLDLAAFYEAQGCGDELGRFAAETVPLFESSGAQAYATDAMRFLRDSAEAGSLTLAALDKMRTFLQRRRNDPQFRFRGER
jgi:hypothetical protein